MGQQRLSDLLGRANQTGRVGARTDGGGNLGPQTLVTDRATGCRLQQPLPASGSCE